MSIYVPLLLNNTFFYTDIYFISKSNNTNWSLLGFGFADNNSSELFDKINDIASYYSQYKIGGQEFQFPKLILKQNEIGTVIPETAPSILLGIALQGAASFLGRNANTHYADIFITGDIDYRDNVLYSKNIGGSDKKLIGFYKEIVKEKPDKKYLYCYVSSKDVNLQPDLQNPRGPYYDLSDSDLEDLYKRIDIQRIENNTDIEDIFPMVFDYEVNKKTRYVCGHTFYEIRRAMHSLECRVFYLYGVSQSGKSALIKTIIHDLKKHSVIQHDAREKRISINDNVMCWGKSEQINWVEKNIYNASGAIKGRKSKKDRIQTYLEHQCNTLQIDNNLVITIEDECLYEDSIPHLLAAIEKWLEKYDQKPTLFIEGRKKTQDKSLLKNIDCMEIGITVDTEDRYVYRVASEYLNEDIVNSYSFENLQLLITFLSKKIILPGLIEKVAGFLNKDSLNLNDILSLIMDDITIFNEESVTAVLQKIYEKSFIQLLDPAKVLLCILLQHQNNNYIRKSVWNEYCKAPYVLNVIRELNISFPESDFDSLINILGEWSFIERTILEEENAYRVKQELFFPLKFSSVFGFADLWRRFLFSNEILFEAIKSNQSLGLIKSYIESGLSIHSVDEENGFSVLHYWAMYGSSEEVLDYIIEQGIPINITDKKGQTPFFIAMDYERDLDILEMLYKKHADIDMPDMFKDAPIHVAICKGYTYVEWLLQHGTNPDARNKKNQTSLHIIASLNTGADIAELLVNYNADVNAKDIKGDNALSKLLNVILLDIEDDKLIEEKIEFYENCYNNDVYDFYHTFTTEKTVTIVKLNIPSNEKENILNIQLKRKISFVKTNKDLLALLLNKVDLLAKNNSNETLLHRATFFYQNPTMIDILLESGIDINAKDNDGNTALHNAVCYNWNPEIIKKFLIKNADIYIKNNLGRTLLHKAASGNNNLEILKILLELGFNINEKDNGGNTALHFAVSNNDNPGIIKFLLDENADINAKNNNGIIPLFIGVGSNTNLDITKILLKKYGDINLRSKNGTTILHFAANINQNPDIVRFLLKKNINIDARDNDGLTALHFAVNNNQNPEIIRLLLEESADVNARDNKGWTALHHSVNNNNPEIIKMFLYRNFDINLIDKYEQTVLHIAVSNNPNPEILKLLIKEGVDINAKDKERLTALHLAVIGNENSKVKILLEMGAEVNSKGLHGETALHWALKGNRDPEILKFLIMYGIDIESLDNYGKKALDYVANNIHPEIINILSRGYNYRGNGGKAYLHYALHDRLSFNKIEYLILRGCQINTQDNEGKIPLHLLVCSEIYTTEDIHKFKIYNANFNTQDINGKTALHYAISAGRDIHIIKTLVELGTNPAILDIDGNTALDAARNCNSSPEIIHFLESL